jgi:hemoglobin
MHCITAARLQGRSVERLQWASAHTHVRGTQRDRSQTSPESDDKFDQRLDDEILNVIRSNCMAEPPPLYERLGGVYAIATVVEDLIDRVMVDSRLNANPRVDEAHHRVAPAGFKYLVTEMVCWAAGGPQKYTGRSMYESHKEMKITAGEWEAFMDDLRQTLDKFGVPAQEQAELKAIVESTRADIVVEPEATTTS